MLVKLTPGRISKAPAAVDHVKDNPLGNVLDVVDLKDVGLLVVVVVVVVEHLKRVELKLFLVLFTNCYLENLKKLNTNLTNYFLNPKNMLFENLFLKLLVL